METVRLFVAVELPAGLKQELVELVGRLRLEGGQSGVRWTDPQGIHLTLKFLGNVATGRLEEIASVLEGAVRGVAPFRLGVSGLGVFPNPRRVRVAWVGLSGDLDVLGRLQKQVEAALASLGFEAEARGFTPHLTLARVRDQVPPGEREAFGRLILGASFESRQGIEVGAISLMRSQLTRQGAVYSRISSIALEGET